MEFREVRYRKNDEGDIEFLSYQSNEWVSKDVYDKEEKANRAAENK